jgi:arylesterase/paraoxonase
MRRLSTAIAVVILLFGVWLLCTLSIGGYWRDLSPRFAGSCREVAGVPGPEDITIHPRLGIAYVSSTDRRAVAAGEPGAGAIYGYDLAAPSAVPVNLTRDADTDFQPHGISLWTAPDGRAVLFAVNHAGGRHTIEKFEVLPGRLERMRTLADPLLVSPNDVVAVGPDLVYVTNDHRWTDGPLRVLEEWLRLPASNVVVFDGLGFRVAASGIRLANGIAASADGTTIYVASPVGREIRVYARDAVTSDLAFSERVGLGTAPDNVEVDSEGRLWVGAHPNLFAFVAHRNGRRPNAPSHVVRAARSGDGWSVEEVFLDPGERLSASSVAAVHGDRLLIGGIWEPRFLDCRMEP